MIDDKKVKDTIVVCTQAENLPSRDISLMGDSQLIPQ